VGGHLSTATDEAIVKGFYESTPVAIAFAEASGR
jgi:hypothetical protein